MRDAHPFVRNEDALHELAPAAERGRRAFDAELLEHDAIESLLVEAKRNLVDRAHVGALDDRAEFDVAEQRDLALHVVGDRMLAAKNEHVGLDTDLHQLAHRVLRRLRLELTGGGDVRHQREMHEDRVLAADVVAELTDRFEERLRFDVADRAADLDDHDVGLGRDALDRRLDLVGDVRNHLHRGTEEFAAAFLGDHVQVDAPGRDVVRLR